MFIPEYRNAMLFAALTAAFATASAAEFSVEGKLTDLQSDNNGGANVTCNGVKIHVPGSATVTSPTHEIQIAGLLSTKMFPGREELGFLGGTCIIEGQNSGATNVAASVYVEPAENVIVGEVSQSIKDPLNPNAAPRPFMIRGVEIVPLTDQHTAGLIVAKKPRNEVGVEINLDTVDENDLSSAEGYVGTDGKMYAYVIETTGGRGDPANDILAQATVQRADLTTRNATNFQYKLEVRGGCTFPHGGTSQVLDMQIASGKDDQGATRWISAANTVASPTVGNMASVTCTASPDVPGGGTYRYRNDNFRATAVPTAVRVRTRNGAAVDQAAQPGAWSEGEEGAPLSIR